jgi:hypothetical protein
LLFFFNIFYDEGASGSLLLTFLSNLPIEAVLSWASLKLLSNAFRSLFLTAAFRTSSSDGPAALLFEGLELRISVTFLRLLEPC